MRGSKCMFYTSHVKFKFLAITIKQHHKVQTNDKGEKQMISVQLLI